MLEFREAKRIVEAMLLAADDPLSESQISAVLLGDEAAEEETLQSYQITDLMNGIAEDCTDRGFELVLVSSGYRFQIREELSHWVSKLWQRKPPRYSRALLETLALIAYRQPITRSEIEAVRGVSVSTQMIRALLDRGWIRELGAKEVPGRPMMYGTTSAFLDYFNLKELSELPPLSDVTELGSALISSHPDIELANESTEQPLNDAQVALSEPSTNLISLPQPQEE